MAIALPAVQLVSLRFAGASSEGYPRTIDTANGPVTIEQAPKRILAGDNGAVRSRQHNTRRT